MFAYKDNGELLPLRREVSGGALMSPGRTDHGFRVARRGRRFGRVILKPCVLMWWLLLAALSFLFIAFFGLKSVFPGHVVSGISTSQEVRIKFEILENVGNVVENITSTSQKAHMFGVKGNTSRRFNGGAEEEQGGSNVTRQTPRNSGKHRKQHFPCEVGFSKSVDHLIEPEDIRNFTQFSLEYSASEGDLVGTKLYEPKFGGHQTLEGREKSFYARNQTLHCGFVKGPPGSPSTGFDIDDKDKAFMSTCRIVVSSCIFGNSYFLRRPATQKMSEFSKKNVCFVMFVDEETLSAMPSDGHVPDASGYVGLWRIVVVRNLPFEDMRRTGKVPKFLQHRLFPSSLYSIWLDSKLRLNTDPMLILEYFLWRTGSEYAISNHYDRHCVWEEVLQNKRLNKYNHTAIDEQFKFYQSDGLTKFDPLDTDTPLPSYVPEGSFIVRAHTPMSNLFSCLWFNEVDRFTSRDQLSFAYTYLKLRRLNPDKPFYLNMFKDCERRALTKLFRHKAVAHPPPHVIN